MGDLFERASAFAPAGSRHNFVHFIGRELGGDVAGDQVHDGVLFRIVPTLRRLTIRVLLGETFLRRVEVNHLACLPVEGVDRDAVSFVKKDHEVAKNGFGVRGAVDQVFAQVLHRRVVIERLRWDGMGHG